MRIIYRAGSRPWDKGGSVIQTLRKGRGGGLQKNFFRPFGSQFGLKIRGGPGSPGGPSLGSATDLSRTSFRTRAQIMLIFPNYAKKYDSKNWLRPLGSAIAGTITRKLQKREGT